VFLGRAIIHKVNKTRYCLMKLGITDKICRIFFRKYLILWRISYYEFEGTGQANYFGVGEGGETHMRTRLR